jgi:predicted nucleic acid binding AN1-type Zn finger protein
MLPKNLLEEFNKAINAALDQTKLQELTNQPSVNKTLTEQNNISTNLENKTEKTQKNRCTHCNKKTGILGFGCRCGGNFCAGHRFTDQHNCPCSEEIKKEDLANLSKNNIKVVADKITRI